MRFSHLLGILVLLVSDVGRAEPSPTPTPSPAVYLAKTKRLRGEPCARVIGDCGPDVCPTAKLRQDLLAYGRRWCREHDGVELAADCRRGYHLERQWACFGYGSMEIPTARVVCHLDGERGARAPCGLECAPK